MSFATISLDALRVQKNYDPVLQVTVTKSCDQALETIFLIGQLLANGDCALQR